MNRPFDIRRELQGRRLLLPAGALPTLVLELPASGDVRGRLHVQVHVPPSVPGVKRSAVELRFRTDRVNAGLGLVARVASSVACVGTTSNSPRLGGVVFPVLGGFRLEAVPLDAEAAELEVFLEAGEAEPLALPSPLSVDVALSLAPAGAVGPVAELGPPPHRCSRVCLLFDGDPTLIDWALLTATGGNATAWQRVDPTLTGRRVAEFHIPPHRHLALRSGNEVEGVPASNVLATWSGV